MNRSRFILRVVLSLLFIFAVCELSAVAQGKGHRPWGAGGGRKHENMERRAKNLENLRMLKLLELLDLTDEQSPRFIERFVRFRKDFKTANFNIQLEIGKLAELLKSDTAEVSIKEAVDKVNNLKISREKVLDKFHDEVTNILTIQQIGLMVIFEERFERELIESVRGFHDRPAPPMPDEP